MSKSDLRKWAREEIIDMVKHGTEETIRNNIGRRLDIDADEELALRRECNRVLKFLGVGSTALLAQR